MIIYEYAINMFMYLEERDELHGMSDETGEIMKDKKIFGRPNDDLRYIQEKCNK